VTATGPHASQTPIRVGAPPEQAAAALILVHGRGGSAEDILGIAEAIDGRGFSIIAPQAAGHTWYPQSFLAPVEANEPGRSSGLSVLESIVQDLAASGLPADRVVLAGFSQGACLTLEYVARNPRRYGGVAGLTGGLIGPAGTLNGYLGSLDETPILLSSGDPDPHVPWPRVEESAEILRGLGAQVELQRYRGRAHTVSRDELVGLERLVQNVLRDSLSGVPG
jgi:predicted esterase